MKINFYALFRQIVGQKSIELESPSQSTVNDLLDQVVSTYPELAAHIYDDQHQLFPHVHIFVNGQNCAFLLAGQNTILDRSETVDIFPPVEGGCF